MSHHFHVNVGRDWTFEVDDATLVSSLGGPNGAARADSDVLLRDALAAPIDFPSLANATVPGDRIVVAVDPLLPDADAALRGVAEAILRAGAQAARLAIVLPPSLADLAGAWKRDAGPRELTDVPFAVHDPGNRAELAYLAATSDGRPIYLNRLLCDADLLIPVTCVPPPAHPRWRGIHGSVYPALADADALGRYRARLDRLDASQQALSCKEVDEVGWLLGVCVSVGVVPGRNGTVHAAAAGTPQRVCEHCVQVATEAWRRELPRRVPLVITLVGSAGGQVSWDDFATALVAARQAAGDDGAVAVCGNFTKGPGRSLRRLVDAADLQAVEQRLGREMHEDSWAARELAYALQRGPVYFAGGLSDELVEGLGMAPIGGPDELARLTARYRECVVINDAHLAAPTLAE